MSDPGFIVVVVAAGAAACTLPGGTAAADPARGEALYESRCGACHSIDSNRVGPRHRGLIGRRAGSVAGYDYSAAFRDSRVVWDEQTLDRWLADPEALIPGQRMNYSVSDPRDRADLIAFLRFAR